jgi:dienelactone hydrolase
VAKGRLAGSFVVRNKGSARAKRFSASLAVRVSKSKYRTVKRFKLRALRRKASRKVKVSMKSPAGLPTGKLAVRVCTDTAHKLRERSERNNCRGVGKVRFRSGSGTPTTPVDSRPTNPIPFTKDQVFTLNTAQSNYWVYVPSAYDSSHATPITLFVWSHGCGGQSEGDINTISPGGAQSYIAITVGGREGQCWDPGSDGAKLLAAIADMKTHFNINPRRVILGGYSSGGDLSYRTAFYNSRMFAGLLAENTSPFRDTGSSQSASLGAASFKFHVVHLAHTGDDSYPIDGVRSETDAMKAAGFPIERVERPGGHYDEDTGSSGTDYDLKTLLLPHLNDGWLSP